MRRYRGYSSGKSKAKYGNRKITEDGITFDSLGEHRRYCELKLLLLLEAGEITNLEVHPKFVLLPAFTDSEGKVHRPITYTADFRYIEKGITVVEDVKGFRTRDYILREKMLLYITRDKINFSFRVIKI